MLNFANKVLEEARSHVWDTMEILSKLSDELAPMLIWKGEESPKLSKAYEDLALVHNQIEKCLDVYKEIQAGIRKHKNAEEVVEKNKPKKNGIN